MTRFYLNMSSFLELHESNLLLTDSLFSYKNKKNIILPTKAITQKSVLSQSIDFLNAFKQRDMTFNISRRYHTHTYTRNCSIKNVYINDQFLSCRNLPLVQCVFKGNVEIAQLFFIELVKKVALGHGEMVPPIAHFTWNKHNHV